MENQGFKTNGKDVKSLKEELCDARAPLDRGAEATSEDQERVGEVIRAFWCNIMCSLWI